MRRRLGEIWEDLGDMEGEEGVGRGRRKGGEMSKGIGEKGGEDLWSWILW